MIASDSSTGAAVIIIIEDDEASRDSLCLLMECEGLAVQGFESCEAFLAEGPSGDAACFILDVHMAGMSGLDLLERLRADGSRTPAIVVSGNSSPALTERAFAAGAEVVLDKPFDAAALVDLVLSLLDPRR